MTSNNEKFYKRLKSLSGIKGKVDESKGLDTRTLIGFERSKDGTAYGIVKENHSYFIKKSLIRESELKSSDFTYISGFENKGKFEFNSLSEAEKQRNFYVKGINEAWNQGGVYFKNEETPNAAPKLDVKENVNSFLRERITESKKNILAEREVKFKTTLTPTKEENKSKGLMPEAANMAVKKALGILKEDTKPFEDKNVNTDDVVTSDSEIKDKDKVSEKSGKEESTAPITDKNAKAKADKATASGTKDANKKGDSSKSIAVNQANKALKESEDLVTADSEIITNDSPANSNQSKESAQAPINDENAKSEAEKRDAKGAASAAISNNTEEQDDSEPFDDKENAGDESSDIVSEDVNKGVPFDKKKAGGKDIVAADSDQKEADRVANSKKVTTKAESSHTDKNQPEKGQKEEKGKKLEPKASEKDIVAEGDMITADSEIKDGDKVANKTKTNLPKKTGKSEITADSELEAAKALANMTKTKLPNPIAEGEELITADSEIDAASSPANDVSEAGDDGEAEIDAAAAALDDLDVATDAEETPAAEPAMDAPLEEPAMDSAEPAMDGDLPAMDGSEEAMDGAEEEAPAEDGAEEEAPAEDGGGDDLMTKEIEKLVGKLTQKVRNTDLTPDQAKGHLKSLINAFETDLGDVDVEDRKEMSNAILKAQTGSLDGEESSDEEGDSMPSGMENDAENAIDNKIEDLKGGEEAPVEEPSLEEPVMDAPVEEDEVIGDKEMCAECGTFESYMESRGYSKDDLAECSSSEMGNLVNGYAQAHEEGMNDGDFENVALFVTPEVANEVNEYGSGGFIEKLQPFLDNVSEDQKMTFGSHEPMLSMEEDEEEMDVPVEEPEMDAPAEEPVMDAPVEEPVSASVAPVGFAGNGEVLGAGVVKPHSAPMKSVEVDLMTGRVNVQVTEGEDRVRKYVRNKLEELAGKKKMKIDESKKSDSIKKLDRLIEQQWKMYGKELKSQLNGKK